MYLTTPDSETIDAKQQVARISIAIADDYPVLVAGMRQSLACDDIDVVAESTQMDDLLGQVSLKTTRDRSLRVRDHCRPAPPAIA